MYDLDVRTDDGQLVERWTGLRLQAVRKQDGSGPWVPALLGPYLQRRTEEILPQELRGRYPTPDTSGPAKGVSRPPRVTRQPPSALGARHRSDACATAPDGKPETDGTSISVSHGAGLTIAVAAGLPVGCDMEAVVARSQEDWHGLLGGRVLRAGPAAGPGERGEDLETAATRVWGAMECLRKTGHARIELVVAGSPRADALGAAALGARHGSPHSSPRCGRPPNPWCSHCVSKGAE